MTRRIFDVLLEDTLVGHLVEADTGQMSFHFVDSYRRLARRPVLSQKFEDDLHRDYRGKKGKVPAFFANLVPEGALRDLIEDSAGISAGDDLALLSVVGVDLPGAVVLRPSSYELDDDEELSPHKRDDQDDEGHDKPTAGLRFSLAGVQLKFSVLCEDDKLTMPAHGVGGEWIAKLPSSRFPGLPENEHTILEWARAAGFEVPACRLYATEDIQSIARDYLIADAPVLAIRRYDRDRDRRIHQEDFAQVAGLLPRRKYDHVTYDDIAVLARSIVGEPAYDEVIRRLVLIVASGNSDAHLKNWSLIYRDGVSAELSPLYDQVCTVAWPEIDRKLALKLGGTKEFGEVSERTFRRLAERAGADPERTARLACDTVAQLARAWNRVAEDAPMRPEHLEALGAHWKRVPLLRDSATGGAGMTQSP